MTDFDEEEAMIDREVFEEPLNEHSDSEGYDSYLASQDEDDSLSSSDDDASSSSSSADESERGSFWDNHLFTPVSALRRRAVPPRLFAAGKSDFNDDDHHSSGDDQDSKTRHRPYRSRGEARIIDRCCPTLCRGAPINVVLGMSFLFWLFMYLTSSKEDTLDLVRASNVEFMKSKLLEKRYGRRTPGEIAQLRKEQMQKTRLTAGPGRILQDAEEGALNLLGGRKKKKNREELLPGCEYAEWQKRAYPTCNDLHEIDLQSSLQLRNTNNTARTTGYIGSGLWRQVWKVDSRSEVGSIISDMGGPTVLKLMKGEHYEGKDTHRNLERHRRDALVMEQLTSSPNIIDMYAFCGNSVVTEHAESDLDTIIFKKKGTDFPSRKTPDGRLRLALDVARGIADVHNIRNGPIIHADITPGQYLVGQDGRIKLNDFNRCRFIPRRNSTGETCEVKIPSAPGVGRSPEEYAYVSIDEKADMYSVANILYSVLTGQEPWVKLTTSKVKKKVLDGQKPPISKDILMDSDSTDARLAALIDLAYELEPQDRLSASELVDELEAITQQTITKG